MTLDTLVARLDRLEAANARLARSNRRLAATALGLVLVAAAALAPWPRAAAEEPLRVLEGSGLLLRNETGKKALEIKAEAGATALRFFDDEGRVAGAWVESKNAAGILLYRADAPVVGLSRNANGTCGVTVFREGKACALLGSTNDMAGLDLLDARGKSRIELAVRGDAAALAVKDADEKTRARIGMDRKPVLAVLDADGSALFSKP
jgi:hypothetical protein